MTVALVALAVLVGAGWWQYRDPTFLTRVNAMGRLELPWEPRLRPNLPNESSQPSREPPVLLQKVHSARAVREAERGAARDVDADAALTPEEARQRAANYEAWLRAQGLTRLNEPEQP